MAKKLHFDHRSLRVESEGLGAPVGETEEGARFVANTPTDRALLEHFARDERVGSTGRVRVEQERHVFHPA